jgi:hypothetical protein
MQRLLAVAVGGVATLLSLGVAGIGAALLAGEEAGASRGLAIALLVVGAAGFLAGGVTTAWLVVAWRRRRNERSPRP